MTMFALVLSIGIVVDNAIVVVEAVHAKLENNPSLSAFNATSTVMDEITSAIISIQFRTRKRGKTLIAVPFSSKF